MYVYIYMYTYVYMRKARMDKNESKILCFLVFVRALCMQVMCVHMHVYVTKSKMMCIDDYRYGCSCIMQKFITNAQIWFEVVNNKRIHTIVSIRLMYMQRCEGLYLGLYIHICIYTYMYIYIYVYICICTCSQPYTCS